LGAVASILIVVLAGTAVSAQQRWYDAYEDALEAIDRRQWAKAEQLLKSALALNPKQGRKVYFYSTIYQDYLPEYYLAVVYANQQRAQEALDLFAKVEQTGLVQRGSREYPDLQRLTASVRAQLEKERLARVQAQQPPPPRPGLPDSSSQTANAATAAAGGKPPETPEAAAARVEAAARRERLTTLLSEASAEIDAGRLSTARERLTEARGLGVEPDRVVDLDRRLAIASAERAAEDALAGRDWREAQRLVKELRLLDPRNRRVADFDAAITRALAAVATLRGALRAFYDGDYNRTITLLEPMTRGDVATRAIFYLACSHAALGLLAGPEGRARLDQGRQLYARVRTAAPELAADRRLISPTILGALENRGTGPANRR
jgi:hypothetical protein